MELYAQHSNNEFAILPVRGFAEILDPIYLIRGKERKKVFLAVLFVGLCTLHSIENGDKNSDVFAV